MEWAIVDQTFLFSGFHRHLMRLGSGACWSLCIAGFGALVPFYHGRNNFFAVICAASTFLWLDQMGRPVVPMDIGESWVLIILSPDYWYI